MKKPKAKLKRKYNTHRNKEDVFFYLDNSPKFSAGQNNDANRSLIASIFSQAYDDFLYIHKAEIKPPKKDSKRKYIRDVDKMDRLETCIDFLDKENPLFIYYCELLDFDPDWVARKMYSRIRDYYFNKADIYLRKQGMKRKKKIKLPVEGIPPDNLYCSERIWKNINSKCPHGKEVYCKQCLDELAQRSKSNVNQIANAGHCV